MPVSSNHSQNFQFNLSELQAPSRSSLISYHKENPLPLYQSTTPHSPLFRQFISLCICLSTLVLEGNHSNSKDQIMKLLKNLKCHGHSSPFSAHVIAALESDSIMISFLFKDSSPADFQGHNIGCELCFICIFDTNVRREGTETVPIGISQ